MLVCFLFSQKSSESVLITLFIYIFILFHSRDFYYSVFRVTYPFFCLSFSAIDSFQCIFHFSYYIVQFCLYVLQFSLVFVNHNLDMGLYYFSEILYHLYEHYSKFFFRQIASILSTQLFLQIFFFFYLAPLFASDFSVVSFFLNYCVCGLLSRGCRIVFLLATGVCFPVGEVDIEQGLPFALQLLLPCQGHGAPLVVEVEDPRHVSYLCFCSVVLGRLDQRNSHWETNP